MEDNSSIFIQGKLYNPIVLNENDVLIINTPNGEARFTLERLLILAKRYGDSFHSSLVINGENVLIKSH